MTDELQKQDDDLANFDDWTRLSQGDRHNRIARVIKKGMPEVDEDAGVDKYAPEPMRDMLRAFVQHDADRGMETSEHTVKAYTKAAGMMCKWRGDLAIHRMDESEAKRFRAWLQSELSPKSVDTFISGARRTFDALQWCGFRDDKENPFSNIKTTETTDPDSKADPYSIEELNALLEVGDERDRAIFLLAADAGLRLAEICALEWRDIDRTNENILVRDGKGGKNATVHATERLLDALSAFKQQQGANDEDPVISVSRRRVQQILEQRCNRADVRCRGIHNLRHSCGTRLYQETRDLQLVAKHLRHSSIKTAQRYAKLADADYEAGVNALDSNGVRGGKK